MLRDDGFLFVKKKILIFLLISFFNINVIALAKIFFKC